MRIIARTLIVVFALVQVACATYQGKVSAARRHLEANEPQLALQKLEPLAKEESKDQLIYLLDYATTLQLAGDFKASSEAFIQADRLSDAQDYVSVTKQAGSLLFAQELVQYAGEDFEKLLINAMGAINFALMQDLESARVETRRLTEKLEFFRGEGKKEYEDNPFVFYLNAHIWEANRDWDSALIDFEKAYKLGITNDLIKQDLLRASQRARRNGKLKKYKAEFKLEPNNQYKNSKLGELVVIYQQGWGPRKAPNPDAPRFPILVPESSRTERARIKLNGEVLGVTELVYNLEQASIRTLNEQYGKLVAKRLAGVVAKEVVASQVSKENEGLGFLLRVAMHASDRADLRQWSTLPETIQMAHFYLPAGEHKLVVEGLSSSGDPTGELSSEIPVVIKARKKTFVGWRSVR